MSSLLREIENVQNPAIGAAVLHSFALGHREDDETQGVPIALVYLILPMMLHEETRSIIKSTRRGSGLVAAVAKFASSANPRNDLVLAIGTRSIEMRDLTTQSLALAISVGLIAVNGLELISLARDVRYPNRLSSDVKQILREAEKVGAWFSDLTPHEIATMLKVRF